MKNSISGAASPSANPLFNLGTLDDSQLKNVDNHVASKIAPDTLFTFTPELRWLVLSLKVKMLSPRYCEEVIEKYAKLPDFPLC